MVMDETEFEALAQAVAQAFEADQADPFKACCTWVNDSPLAMAGEEEEDTIPF